MRTLVELAHVIADIESGRFVGHWEKRCRVSSQNEEPLK